MCQWKRFTKNKNKFLMFMYIRFLILLFDSHWHVIFQFGPFELDFRLINSQRDLMFQSFEEITWELNISSQNICCYWLLWLSGGSSGKITWLKWVIYYYYFIIIIIIIAAISSIIFIIIIIIAIIIIIIIIIVIIAFIIIILSFLFCLY